MDLARNLKVDSISRLHPTAPHSVRPDETVADALALMRREKVGCLVVCENGRLVGVFTERDLMRRILATRKPLTTLLRDCMTPSPVTVHAKDPVAVAIRKMEEGGYRHLPVVDESGRPTGILSVKRIVRYLVEHFPSLVYNLPPDPGAVPNQPEGA